MSKQIDEVMGLVDTLIASLNEAHHANSEGWKHGCYQAADNTYDAISARLRELLPVWQPIETAPKNGGNEVLAGYFNDSGEWLTCLALPTEKSGLLNMEVSGDFSHWMPLPKAPE